VFLLVPAYLGCPGQKAVKRLCVCVCVYIPTSVYAATLSEDDASPANSRQRVEAFTATCDMQPFDVLVQFTRE